jgi:hypothetical protein
VPRKKKTEDSKKITEGKTRGESKPETMDKPVLPPPPGKPITKVTVESTTGPDIPEKSEEPKEEELNFANEDMINEAIRIVNEALIESRKDKFAPKELSFHELNFINNLLGYSKTQIIRTKQIVETYSERDKKAQQSLASLLELMKFKIDV